MNYIFKYFIYISLFISYFNTLAQTESSLEYSGLLDTYYFRGPIKFIGNIGVAGYNGPENKSINFKSPSPYIGGGIVYQHFPYTDFVGELNYIKLKYDYDLDATNKASFESKNLELSIYSRIYFLPERITKRQQTVSSKVFRPYILAGFGLVRYKAKTSVNSAVVLEQKTPRYSPVIPLGIGAEYKIDNKISVLVELSRRLWLSKKDISNILDGYSMASLKVQYNPWGVRKKKKIKLSAPTTPTKFYSPNGVAPNQEKRDKENGESPSEDQDNTIPVEEENPFGDFEENKSEEKDPFDF